MPAVGAFLPDRPKVKNLTKRGTLIPPDWGFRRWISSPSFIKQLLL